MAYQAENPVLVGILMYVAYLKLNQPSNLYKCASDLNSSNYNDFRMFMEKTF